MRLAGTDRSREQAKTVSAGMAWLAVVGGIAVSISTYLFGSLPFVGFLGFFLWPTSVLLTVCLTVAAVVASMQSISLARYMSAAFFAYVALSVLGVLSRMQGAAAGSDGVEIDSSVSRKVQARVREPVALDSAVTISYDTALYEAAGPMCESKCFAFERIDLLRRKEWEEPKDALESIGVRPIAAGPSRLTVSIETREAGNRLAIDIRVQDTGQTTATMHAVVPSTHRKAGFPPPTVRFVLEANPLVYMLMPSRKHLKHKFIRKFLEDSIVVLPAGSGNVRILNAKPVSLARFNPSERYDRDDPEFLKKHHQHEDSRCAEILTFESNRNVGDLYVTFHASKLSAPQVRITDQYTPICAGDSVYKRVRRIPHSDDVGSSLLGFERYALNGEYLDTLHIRVPSSHSGLDPGEVATLEPGSLVEENGHLRFRLHKIRFEWARDEAGLPVRRTDGAMLEYGLVDQTSEYEVALMATNP